VTRPSSPSPPRPARSELRTLAVIAAVGLAVRVAFALVADRTDLGFNDQFLYHHMADGLARGDGYQIFGEATLRWPPAFPFLVSLVYRVTGADPTAALLVNAVLSALAIPLVHWCARPMVGRRAALAAAAVVAVLPGQWLFAGTVLTEPLAALQILLVVGIVVRHPPSVRAGVGLGLVIGFSALTRGEGTLLGLVVLVGWWPRVPWRRLVAPVAVTAGVALVVITPWIVRNSALAGERTGVSLNSAETLYAGHNPEADGGATYASTEVLGPTVADTPRGVERELAQAKRLRQLATTWAREHPREELALIPKRLLHLVEGDGNVVSIWIEASSEDVLGPARTPLEVAADVSWYGLFAAFTVTIVVRRRLLRETWARAVLLLPALSLVLYGVLLYGNFRYRIPYEPLLALLVCAAWLPAATEGSAPEPDGHGPAVGSVP
jgi:4-amino-4-deoxy-L-arabinose transferase-like glycosyltransferase